MFVTTLEVIILTLMAEGAGCCVCVCVCVCVGGGGGGGGGGFISTLAYICYSVYIHIIYERAIDGRNFVIHRDYVTVLVYYFVLLKMHQITQMWFW